jgi:hypothetical protein
MTPEEWTLIRGVLKKGYGVASGPSSDYPYGALQQQLPIFKSRGLDLLAYFHGTLNIDIRPSPSNWICQNTRFATSTGRTCIRRSISRSLLEVIAPSIPDIRAGQTVEVHINPLRVTLIRQPAKLRVY